MHNNKYSSSILYILVALLIIQVSLSAGIVWKLSLLEQKALTAANVPDQAKINAPEYVDGVSADDDPTLGAFDAPVTVIEFADFECPACMIFEETIKEILSTYEGQVHFVYRDFPLTTIHPNAMMAAQAAECAGEQNHYWEMHDLLFANQQNLDYENLIKYASQINLDHDSFRACLDKSEVIDEIKKDIEDGEQYGVMGTPTFFINGYRFFGISPEMLENQINSIITEGGEK